MVHLIKFPLNMFFFSCFTATTSTFWHGRVFPTPLAWNVVLCVLLHGGHQGAVSGGKGSQKAKLAISYEVYDVVPAPWRAEDHQRRVRTGRWKHHFFRFIVMPFWNLLFFRSSRAPTSTSTTKSGVSEKRKDSLLNTST